MRRDNAFAALPALLAAVLLAGGSAAALPMTVALCSGGSSELPGKVPGCDQACHAGCQRRKGRV